jgi:hypothetical protein
MVSCSYFARREESARTGGAGTVCILARAVQCAAYEARTRAGRGEDTRHLFVHLAGRNFPFAKVSLYLVVPNVLPFGRRLLLQS